jgi:multiple sugar transport system substrate-binding protein
MASWLFMQFLLTNDVQIDYASTEGYIPVTEKAIASEKYQSYIGHPGDSTEEHYSVKLDATRLLTDNIENTFITPVFNGSARVRQAAGELIDVVNKAPRRNQIVDEKYLTKLFGTVTTQYKLDELKGVAGGKNASLGHLPAGSVALIVGLSVSWAAIIGVALYKEIKKRSLTAKPTDKQ